MDLPPEELQFMTILDILKEFVSIPKQSPQTFYLITLSLIFPLSFAILAHSLFTHPIFTQLKDDPYGPNASSAWSKLLTFQLCYIMFLFAFSLLSTAAVVFAVASLYTSKPVSFQSTMSAMPSVLKRLLLTFIWVSICMVVYNIVFIVFLMILFVAIDTQNLILCVLSFFVIFLLFLFIHVYFSGLWHLASVVSVLEPIYGFAAMKKSHELLQGRSTMAFMLVFGYLTICGVINYLFGSIVVNGSEEYGIFFRIVFVGFLVGVLVIVNLMGLLVQSIFYYVCKSYHHQEIDKSSLYDQLGGYLGEYVPLTSNIQMENLEDIYLEEPH